MSNNRALIEFQSASYEDMVDTIVELREEKDNLETIISDLKTDIDNLGDDNEFLNFRIESLQFDYE